jgi:hypothetical protein
MNYPFQSRRRDPKDQNLVVTFFSEAAKDEAASDAAGRPIFKEVDWIHIHIPTSPMDDVRTMVNKGHIQRFPDEYEHYKRTSRAEATEGTPLKMWPAVEKREVFELAEVGITTVEQLAELTATDLRKHDWLTPYAEKARVWLASITDNSVVLELEAEVNRLKAEVERLSEENIELRRAQNEKRVLKQATAKAAQ